MNILEKNMFEQYLKQIGLEYLINDLETLRLRSGQETDLNNFVKEVFEKEVPEFSEEEIKDLYAYDIPKLSADGSCSILEEKNETPYDLSKIFGRSPSFTNYLWRLKQIVKNLYALTNVDWLGVYKKSLNTKNEPVLVKLSYLGLFSRAEFPLTKEFAKKSNNSTVGLSGIAKVIQDVSANQGPYYKCDGKVQSEFCLPILNEDNKVTGIIDAEAFPKEFFSGELLLQIAKVAFNLGKITFRI